VTTPVSGFLTSVVRLLATPETERLKDTWDGAVFGIKGRLRFGIIGQPWMREAAKRWAAEELPTHRGRSQRGLMQAAINSFARLSDSLRIQRADTGDDPTALARRDMVAFLNRLAFLEDQEKISARQRYKTVLDVRRMLARMRSLGLTNPGEPMHGLPDASVRSYPNNSELDTTDGPFRVIENLFSLILSYMNS
jgi:hypothetical protein